MKGQNLKAASFLLIIFLLGYFREFTFLNVNYQLWYFRHPEEGYFVHSFYHFLHQFSSPTLYKVKWILTIFFAFLFCGVTYIAIYSIFKQHKKALFALYSLIALFLVSGTCWIIGYITGNHEQGYKLSRVFMGLAQSPIVLMILIPAFHLEISNTKK